MDSPALARQAVSGRETDLDLLAAALAATPAGWAAFATRNAELAATLTGPRD